MKGKKVLILMTAMLLLGACTNGKEDCRTKESQTPSPVTQENSAESVSESVSESLQSETEGESTEADVTMPTFNVNDFYADDAQGDGGNGGKTVEASEKPEQTPVPTVSQESDESTSASEGSQATQQLQPTESPTPIPSDGPDGSLAGEEFTDF